MRISFANQHEVTLPAPSDVPSSSVKGFFKLIAFQTGPPWSRENRGLKEGPVPSQ